MLQYKILIVEDESIIAMELERRLAKMGYKVTGIAMHADTALQKMEADPPDIVMMDIHIKGARDGIQTSEDIQARYGIPVIFLTAHADQATIERAKVTQPFGYLLKPFREHELRATIEMALYRQRMEKQMRESERLVLLGRLLGTISHELNNPLQAIQNTLFLLKEETGISPQGKSDLDVITVEAGRMADILAFLRDTHRPLESEEIRPVQLNDILREVFTLMSAYLHNHQVLVDFYPQPDLPAIPGMTIQLRQVTLNLFMNAVEAMPNGGTLTIRTAHERDRNAVLVSVSDTGMGIPANFLPNIFKAFFTTKPMGAGLGLTISQDIVLKHNGQITAENNPDQGATFKVRFPVI